MNGYKRKATKRAQIVVHITGKEGESQAYSNGRGVLEVQEFNFSAIENVFEALKYGYGDYTRVHLTFDLEGIKTARMIFRCTSFFDS